MGGWGSDRVPAAKYIIRPLADRKMVYLWPLSGTPLTRCAARLALKGTSWMNWRSDGTSYNVDLWDWCVHERSVALSLGG